MDSHLTYLSKKRFGSLDGLRTISITAVLWRHAGSDWSVRHYIDVGLHGVLLFFAISGFLITTLLVREQQKNGQIDLKAFYLRRILRISPLYYGVLLLYILLVTFIEKDPVARQTFYNNLVFFATYTTNLFIPLNGRVIFYFSWSLAAEEQFYLVWPPLLYLVRKVSNAFILLLVIFLVIIFDHRLLGRNDFTLIPIAIVGGALLAVTLHTEKGFRVLYFLLGRTWSVLAVLLLLILAIKVFNAQIDLIQVILVLLVGSCVIREDHLLAPLLQLKWVAYIGQISYGIYMLHLLCLDVVMKALGYLHLHTNEPVNFVLIYGASILAAGLSFKYYEAYFLRLKHKLER